MRKPHFLVLIFLVAALLLGGCELAASTPVPTNASTGDDLNALLTQLASQPPATSVIPGGGLLDPTQVQTATAGTAQSKLPAVVTATPTIMQQLPTSTIAVPTPGMVVPTSYQLQKGEFPYCIARRFNINVDTLLGANGLSRGGLFSAGLKLTIPLDADPFGEERALIAHPAQYTVITGDTFYMIACKFGDVWPEQIASENGMTLEETLTSGTVLDIP